MPEKNDAQVPKRLAAPVNRFLTIIDDIILLAVAVGIIGVACLLLAEAASDFIYFTKHSISHIISDLLFILIIMELFRQVMRQINRQAFSLNPFIYIGVIASIRGQLLTQMKLGMGEVEWKEAVIQLGIHAVIVLVLIAGLYIYTRSAPCRRSTTEPRPIRPSSQDRTSQASAAASAHAPGTLSAPRPRA